MIQELIKAKVDAMTANGYNYTFLHSETDWQNIVADEMTFPAVFMDMPVSFDPIVKPSGAFERKYVVVCIFLFKSNLDDNEFQRYDSFKLAEEAQKQFHLMLDNDQVNFKGLEVQRCYQIQNFLDVNLDGVVMPFTITERPNGSVCVPNPDPVGVVTLKLNSATFLTIDCGNTQNITLTDSEGNELTGYEVLGSSIKIKNSIVTNSNDDILADLLSQESIELADVDNIDSDGSIVPTPAGVPFTCTQGATLTGLEILQTGQTQAYKPYDDGTLQLGDNRLTLDFNNIFGNTRRFSDVEGGDSYSTNNIVLDHRYYKDGVILCYYKNFGSLSSMTWENALNYCALTFTEGGLTGWHQANEAELHNLKWYNQSLNGWYNYAPFNVPNGSFFWTSTTNPSSTSLAVFSNWNSYMFSSFDKNSAVIKPVPCRYCTLAELGISI